jgi:hypothetical protein
MPLISISLAWFWPLDLMEIRLNRIKMNRKQNLLLLSIFRGFGRSIYKYKFTDPLKNPIDSRNFVYEENKGNGFYGQTPFHI